MRAFPLCVPFSSRLPVQKGPLGENGGVRGSLSPVFSGAYAKSFLLVFISAPLILFSLVKY